MYIVTLRNFVNGARYAAVQAAFKMFDIDNSGLLSATETVEMLKALDVEIGNEEELANYVKVPAS